MVLAYFAYCVSILGKIDNKPHVHANYLEYAWSAYSIFSVVNKYQEVFINTETQGGPRSLFPKYDSSFYLAQNHSRTAIQCFISSP